MALREMIVGQVILGIAVFASVPVLAMQTTSHSELQAIMKPAPTGLVPGLADARYSGISGDGALPPRAVRRPPILTMSELKAGSNGKSAAKKGDHDGHDHRDETAGGDHAEDDGHDHGKEKAGDSAGKHEGHDHPSDGKADGSNADNDGHDHGKEKAGDSAGKHDGHDHPREKAAGGHAEEGDGHAHGGEGGHSDGVKLTSEQMKEFGVDTQQVEGGALAVSIMRPAEVQYDLDRFAHVVPRVAGIVRSVGVKQGDKVEKDDIVAVLESRELADAKAGYLAAKERFALAKDNFDREQTLQKKQITSEKAFFAARSEFAETRIALRLAEQKLHALGVDKERLKQVETEPETDLTTYIMRAPLGGVVVNRHLVLGESVATDREAFVIADVSQVWIDISIYPNDLTKVSAGLPVRIQTENGNGMAIIGKIAHITPNVSEETRTAKARVVLDNQQMRLRPGMFVNALIDISTTDVAVRVPKSALQNHEGKEVVFVSESGKFEPRPVKLGRRNGQFVEVVSGLATGEIIAAEGSFVIKSQLSKESFGDGHNH
ncbi:MAG: hypothetical protein APF80_17520 [Alphaproteobacteria bacterium BRH_c36]|nr:MAG: hypothetical protein APF80_17520 [Alphaproteobacteria bacterium BRH_c36]